MSAAHSTTKREVPSHWPEAVAALVPIATAILAGDVASDAKAMRDVVVGATIAGDHAWTAPIPQLLAPLTTILPLGDVDARAAIALSLPAAVAAALVARRASTEATTTARRTIAMALGALAGVLLARVDPTAAIVVVAIEAAIATLEKRASAALAIVAGLIAFWATPRVGWLTVVPWIVAGRSRFRARFLDVFAIGAPIVVAALVVSIVRGSVAWLVLGRTLVDGSTARSMEAIVSKGVEMRSAIAAGALVLVALVATSSTRRVVLADRVAVASALVAGVAAWLLRPFGAAAVAICVLLPTAGASLGALHLAVERFVEARIDRRVRPFRVLAWIVPALVLGWSARGFEDDLRARRATADAAAAAGFSGISTIGAGPRDAVYLLDDEPRLVAWAHDRTVLALRPDVRVLPARSLLLGGASRIATRTLDETPAASDVLRAMIAHGDLDEPDVSPLTEHQPLLVALSASRVRTLARHFDATGGPIVLSLERVDPSDRRIRRAPLDHRVRFVVDALATRGLDDPIRSILRGDALREARIASIASDRDAALYALARARTLGADGGLVDAWTAKVQSKKTLENEPETDDER